jgi:hypothetical protein
MKYLKDILKVGVVSISLLTSGLSFALNGQGNIETINRTKAVIITIAGVSYRVPRNLKINIGPEKIYSADLNEGDLVTFEATEPKNGQLPKIISMEVVLY